jgi:response regulator of citrate/malate metabolism
VAFVQEYRTLERKHSVKANSETNQHCIRKLVESVRPKCALQKESQQFVKETMQAVCERVQSREKSIPTENEVAHTTYTKSSRLEPQSKRKRITPELVSVPK